MRTQKQWCLIDEKSAINSNKSESYYPALGQSVLTTAHATGMINSMTLSQEYLRVFASG
jgi:hypothetical protein